MVCTITHSSLGVNLSLLSRVMSSRLSRGTYNGGLLSTEAGTIARVIADGTITLAGYLGESRLLNVTLLPSLLICITSIIATCLTYNSLYWFGIHKNSSQFHSFLPALRIIIFIHSFHHLYIWFLGTCTTLYYTNIQCYSLEIYSKVCSCVFFIQCLYIHLNAFTFIQTFWPLKYMNMDC